jgi:hypothetical protein
MSKSIDGMGASSKTLSGLSSNGGATGPAGPVGPTGPTGPQGPQGTLLAGGAAGQVPYQSAPSTTIFTNNANGILENLSATNAFTSTITSVKRLTAPAADDLEMIVTGASKKVKLISGAGGVSVNTASGSGTDAWTVAGPSGVLSSALSTANLSLTANQSITTSNGSINSILTPAALSMTDGTLVTAYFGNLLSATLTNYLIQTATAARTLTLQTNAGTLNINTANGTGGWNFAATTGSLSTSTAGTSLSFTNGVTGATLLANSLVVNSSATISASLNSTSLTFASATATIASSPTASTLRLRSNSGNVQISANNGVNNPIVITGANVILLQLNAPFLKTDGTGILSAGTTMLPLNGGTGSGIIVNAPFTKTDASGVFSAGTTLLPLNGGTGAGIIVSAPFTVTDASGVFSAGTILGVANGGTGTSTGPVVSNLQGGTSPFGQILYQSALNTTSMLTAANGVLQMVGTTPSWTTTPTQINTISPAASNFLISNAGVSNTITLSTNAGLINFSTNQGVGNALSILSNSDVRLPSLVSAAILATDASGKIIAGSAGPASTITGGAIGTVLYQSNTNVTAFTNAIAGVLQSNGTTPAFTTAITEATSITVSSTGPPVSCTIIPASITIAGPGAGRTSLLNSNQLTLDHGGALVDFDHNILRLTGTSYTQKVVTAAETFNIETNGGDITFNTTNGLLTTDAWTIAATTGILSSSSANISLTGGNTLSAGFGGLSGTVAPGLISTGGGGALSSMAPTLVTVGQGGASTNMTPTTFDITAAGGAGVTTLSYNDALTTVTDFSRRTNGLNKKITLSTNAGLINFSTDQGVGNALSIVSNSDVRLPSLVSAAILATDATGKIIVGSAGPATAITGGVAGQVLYQSAPNTTLFTTVQDGLLQLTGSGPPVFTTIPSTITGIAPAASDFLINNATTTKTIKLQTFDSAINFSTSGGTNAWSIAGTTGILSSSTSDLNLTAGNKLNVSAGANLTKVEPASVTIEVTGVVSTNIVANAMTSSLLDFTYKVLGGFAMNNYTDNGRISFSNNLGVGEALAMVSNNVSLPNVLSAPFLKTNGGGFISAGTVLPVSAGGTGVSTVTMPKRTVYTTTGNVTLTGVCKYFTAEVTGSGGGGGAGETILLPNYFPGGGGGGGSYGAGHFAYNAGASYYQITIGAGGIGVAMSAGTNGGTTTFHANGVGVIVCNGGNGGDLGTSTLFGVGGIGGTPGTGATWYGGDGMAGLAGVGGGGGGAAVGNGPVCNANIFGAYVGKSAPEGCGGCGANGGAKGGDGGNGVVIITEYYY